MSLERLEKWQSANVERACNEAVRVAISYGLEAFELRGQLAQSWEDVLSEKAQRGREEIEKAKP